MRGCTTIHNRTRQYFALFIPYSTMKNIFILTFCLFLGNALFSQSSGNYDKRLLAKYSEEQIQNLQQNHPSIIAFWTYFLDHGYYISEISASKNYSFVETLDIKESDLNKICLFNLDLPHPLDKYTFYKIQDSNKMLVLYPRNLLVEKFNNLNSQDKL